MKLIGDSAISQEQFSNAIRRARIMGASWRQAGIDVRKRIRTNFPDWPGTREQRLMLAAAVLEGAGEADR